MSNGGGGGNTTTTTSRADPWSGVQPYLQGSGGVPGVLPEAARLYQNNPLQFYPGQTYADLSPETEMSLQMQTDRAISGSPLNNAAQQNLTDTLNGKYLDINSNPYLMAGADNVLSKVLPQIDARFASAGRGNSGLASRAAAQGATDALGGLAFQNYNAERTNQQRAALLAPGLAQQDYADAARLGEVGSVREDFSNQAIQDAMQRFNFNQQAPWNQLGLYNSMLQGNGGGTTVSQQVAPRRSIGAGVLGGAVAGGSLGYMAGGNNPSLGLTAGGAGLGALMGLL